MGQRTNWMLYGAYGHTGRLILDHALRRGHRPVLAGRDASRRLALARETGSSSQHLPLEDGGRVRAACFDAGCRYVDISGEVEVPDVELQWQARRAGAFTPAHAFGSDFAFLVPGTRIEEL